MKAVAFATSLAPLVSLAWRFVRDDLGANPIEHVTRALGWWTLAFLVITLAVTPLRRLARMPWLLRFRRMLGLFAFSYASLHLLSYLWWDQFFDWAAIVRDLYKRPFITAGFGAWLCMVPLAMTSTNAMIRRLGASRWRRLHRLVYLVAALGTLHFLWLVKKDVTEPVLYAACFAALLAARVVFWWQDRSVSSARTSAPRGQTRSAS